MLGGLQQREGGSNQSDLLYVWTNFNLGWDLFALVMSVCLYAWVPIPDMEAQVESQGQGLPNGMAI